MTNREAFKILLPKYMKRANMNQRELANAVGKSESTVSCWLSGRAFPRIDVVEKIAQVLGLSSSDELLTTKGLSFPNFSVSLNESIGMKILEERMERSSEDDELRRLWNSASPAARRAALAVLKSMKEGD